MSNNKLYKKSGFTLVEVLITISIMAIIGSIVLSFIVMGFKSTRFESEQSIAVETARDSINTMIKEIRGANSSELGDYPISLIDDYEFTYYTDIDEDGETEKIRYYLDSLELIKEIIEPGALKDYTGPPASTTIAQYVNNQEESIFIYYDSANNETGAINEVRMIKIILKINVTPEIAPNDIYVETNVSLRNLKSNL